MSFSKRKLVPSLLFLLSAAVSIVAADALDFSLYPKNSQSCLYSAADASACDHSTVPKFNACVCSNGGGFLESAASCLGANDPADVSGVYTTMSTNCADSNTPIAYTSAKWASVASAGASKATSSGKGTTTTKGTTTAKTTVTAPAGSTKILTVTQRPSAGQTSAPISTVTLTPGQVTTVTDSPTGTDSAAAQTTSAVPTVPSKIGTGVIAGAATGGAVILALAGLALFFFLRYRKQKRAAQPESAPFMGPYSGGGNSSNTNTEYKPQHQSYANLPPSSSTGAEKYTPAPPYFTSPSQGYDQHGYPTQQPYAGGYTQVPNNGSFANLASMPSPQNGAIELQGRPGVPAFRHELPT